MTTVAHIKKKWATLLKLTKTDLKVLWHWSGEDSNCRPKRRREVWLLLEWVHTLCGEQRLYSPQSNMNLLRNKRNSPLRLNHRRVISASPNDPETHKIILLPSAQCLSHLSIGSRFRRREVVRVQVWVTRVRIACKIQISRQFDRVDTELQLPT